MKQNLRKQWILWLALLSCSLLPAAPAANPVIPEVSIPLLQQKPIIDGNINETEWAQCMRIEGLMQDARQLASREAVFWLGSDGQKIYLAMQSETPEVGDLLTRVKPAGTANRAVHRDDCIELWLAPAHSSQPGNQKYYQIAVNPLGALYDVLNDPNNQQLPVQPGWRINWDYASSIKDGWWQAEIAIPFAELELEAADLAKPWRLRIGRNWQQPGEQTEWAPRLGGFADQATMPLVRWLPEGPLVRMLSLRHQDNSVDICLELQNRSNKHYTVKSDIFHRVSDNPHNVSQELYELGPGETKLINIRESMQVGKAETRINLSDPETKVSYFKRAFQWQVDRNPKRWQAATTDLRAVSLDFGYYPSYNQIKARLDIAGLESREQVTRVRLQLRPVNGKVLMEKVFPKFVDYRSEMMMATPALAAGEYELLAWLEGENVPETALSQKFVRQKFEWEDNQLGYIDDVIPPFTPLRVEKNKLYSVLREHSISDIGLWEQVLSQDKPLLQAPMYFDIKVDGKHCQVNAKKQVQFVEKKNHQVSYEAEWQAGNISAKMQVRCEMDGLMKVTMDLQQQGNESVDSFDLVIPLQKSIATLLHACGPGLRSNYAGQIPAGNGQVWDSKMTGSHLVGNFVPYLWLGQEGRGLVWCAESDRDWLYDDNKATQTIFRREDCVELRIHFVNRPAALQRPRQIVFALQATPSKPLPGEPFSWRNWVSRTSDEGKEPENWHFAGQNEQQHWRNWVSRTNRRFSPRAYTHFMLAGSSSWGTDSGHAFIYPVKRDFSIYKLLQETRQKGERNLAAEEAWFTRYDPNLSPAELKSRHDHIRWATRNLAGQPDAVVPYTDPRASVFNEEFATYQDEWLVSAYSSRNWDFKNPRAAIAYQVSPGKSFQDYQIWYLKKMLETFADAIYFDNTYLLSTDDLLLGAYRADDNSLRPSVDIFNMRQHLKRVQTLTWQLGKNWLASMSHMTNAQIVPINTWCGTNLEWEWKYGGEDFQSRFGRDMIRTSAIGIQSGSVPFVLGTTGIRGQFSDERKTFLLRSLLGTSLVHEIKNLSCEGILGEIYAKLFDFGYGSPECQVFRYWDNNNPLKIAGAEAEGLLLVHKQEALLLLVSFGPEAVAQLSFDNSKLALKTDGRFFNAETGAELPGGNWNCQVQLPKHDFVLIHYK
ncbi:MAG: glycoside hydrolase domain-containing protein [Lentisphaeria bacterium]